MDMEGMSYWSPVGRYIMEPLVGDFFSPGGGGGVTARSLTIQLACTPCMLSTRKQLEEGVPLLRCKLKAGMMNKIMTPVYTEMDMPLAAMLSVWRCHWLACCLSGDTTFLFMTWTFGCKAIHRKVNHGPLLNCVQDRIYLSCTVSSQIAQCFTHNMSGFLLRYDNKSSWV